MVFAVIEADRSWRGSKVSKYVSRRSAFAPARTEGCSDNNYLSAAAWEKER